MTTQYDLHRGAREAVFFDAEASHQEHDSIRRGSYDVITQSAITIFAEVLAESQLHLEVGAGTQPFSLLLPVQSRPVCVDISVGSLRVARQRAPGPDYVCCDASRLPFRDGVFDGIIGSAILHHLAPNVCRAELARVGKPGTAAGFSEPQLGNPAISLYRRLHPEFYSADERPLSEADLRVWAGDCSVDCYRVDLLGILLSVLPALRGRRLLRGLVSSADAMIARWVPPLRRFFRYVILVIRIPASA